MCGYRDVRFDSKVGQIGPKWDKSGTFSKSVLKMYCQNVLKSDLKKAQICRFRANLTHFGAKPDIPEWICHVIAF